MLLLFSPQVHSCSLSQSTDGLWRVLPVIFPHALHFRVSKSTTRYSMQCSQIDESTMVDYQWWVTTSANRCRHPTWYNTRSEQHPTGKLANNATIPSMLTQFFKLRIFSLIIIKQDASFSFYLSLQLWNFCQSSNWWVHCWVLALSVWIN